MNRTTALLVAALVGAAVPAARADKLDARLNEVAPKVAQKLIDKKYGTVGVLRFQVEAPGIKPGYGTPLSGNLVTRVETGLILHAERDGKPAYGVTRDTGTVAQAQKVGAWPTSLAERKKLFTPEYPLAWGKSKAKADAFITGTLKLSKDFKTTTVTLLAFDKTSPIGMEKLVEFTMPTEKSVLRDLGTSFSLPSEVRARAIKLKKRSDEIDTDAVEIVGQQQQQPTDPDKPATTPKTPKQKQDTGAKPSDVGGVAVRLLVNGAEQMIRESATQGDSLIKWQVESPTPGTKIAFELTNKTDKKLGVVLRLNGLCVVNELKDEAERCGKIHLPAKKSVVVRGFITTPDGPPADRSVKRKRESEGDEPPVPDQPPPPAGGGLTIRPFAVLVGEEASKMRQELGEKAGLIEIDVFEEGSVPQQSQVSQRGLPPSKAAKARESYKGLKTALLQSSGLKTKMDPKAATGGVKARELIVPDTAGPGESIKGGVADFPNPSFVTGVSIKVVPAEAAP